LERHGGRLQAIGLEAVPQETVESFEVRERRLAPGLILEGHERDFPSCNAATMDDRSPNGHAMPASP
jgi:hypothetical protein